MGGESGGRVRTIVAESTIAATGNPFCFVAGHTVIMKMDHICWRSFLIPLMTFVASFFWVSRSAGVSVSIETVVTKNTPNSLIMFMMLEPNRILHAGITQYDDRPSSVLATRRHWELL